MKIWHEDLFPQFASFYKKKNSHYFETVSHLFSDKHYTSVGIVRELNKNSRGRGLGLRATHCIPFLNEKKPMFISPHALLTPLWTISKSVAITYHAKLFMTDDTYWYLLVWHPVLLLWWQDWRNIQLLTTLNRGLLCTQAPGGRRRRSWSLGFLLSFHSRQSRVKRNFSSWKGLNFPFQAPGRRFPRSSFLHWCRSYRRVAPRLRNGRYSTRHGGHGRRRRGRGGLDQTLHDAAAKFCQG